MSRILETVLAVVYLGEAIIYRVSRREGNGCRVFRRKGISCRLSRREGISCRVHRRESIRCRVSRREALAYFGEMALAVMSRRERA